MHSDDQTDERYISLCRVLCDERIDEFDLRELDAWMVSAVGDRQLDIALIEKHEAKSHAEQVQTCRTISECASSLAERLIPLGLPASVEEELFSDWVAIGTVSGAPPNHAERSKDWEGCKQRLVQDLEMLARAATATGARLKVRGGQKGRPGAEWRTALFCQLAARMKQLIRAPTAGNVAHTAREVWNIYFGRNKIMEDDAAIQLIRRGRRKTSART